MCSQKHLYFASCKKKLNCLVAALVLVKTSFFTSCKKYLWKSTICNFHNFACVFVAQLLQWLANKSRAFCNLQKNARSKSTPCYSLSETKLCCIIQKPKCSFKRLDFVVNKNMILLFSLDSLPLMCSIITYSSWLPICLPLASHLQRCLWQHCKQSSCP